MNWQDFSLNKGLNLTAHFKVEAVDNWFFGLGAAGVTQLHLRRFEKTMKQYNAYAGRHVRQDAAKLGQIRKRERRLRKIGLSVLSFPMGPGEYVQWEQSRQEGRRAERLVKTKQK